MTVEDELFSLANHIKRERDRTIFCRYHGWDGKEGATLQIVGDAHGITRERVRQIVKRSLRIVKRAAHFSKSPTLEAILEYIRHQPDVDPVTMIAMLQEKGYIRSSASLAAICGAAEMLGYEVPRVIDNLRCLEKLAMSIARRHTSHWGVVSIDAITRECSRTMNVEVRPEAVRAILLKRKEIDWLDSSSEWLFVREAVRNRLTNNVRKVLSVTQRIGLDELREAIRRHHRMEGVAPPKNILATFCLRMANVSLEGEYITAIAQPDYRKTLGGTERAFVEIFLKNGPLITTPRLQELCEQAGVMRNTFFQYLSYSPIICRYKVGVYGLAGSQVTPAQVNAQKLPQRSRGTLDYGWDDGAVWIIVRLSRSTLQSGVLPFPGRLSGYLGGEFAATSPDSRAIAKLKIRNYAAWGASQILASMGVKPNEVIKLVINLKERKALISRYEGQSLL
jgi:hypothetical protein